MSVPSRMESTPIAVFTPCSNSHPFDERRIPVTRSEENAVKIGRAVARLQPVENNAIFDCKVLSRNHAIMWYEDGQFLIKDTKSSNGTFINNIRLSNSGEESVPRALHSGDILQLGVEIVDNSKKGKDGVPVASGCVTCIVRLYNEKGEECFDRRVSATTKAMPMQECIPKNYTLVSEDQLFMLKQYITEQMFREKLLDQKLRHLEVLAEMTQESSENSWQALINEDRLLSRIEILESQLALYASKNLSDGDLKKQIQEFLEDRNKVDVISKEMLRKAHDQVSETTARLNDVEHGLVNLEEENTFLRRKCEEHEQALKKRQEHCDELEAKFAVIIEEKNAIIAAEKALNESIGGSGGNQFTVSGVEDAPKPAMQAIEVEEQPSQEQKICARENEDITARTDQLSDEGRNLLDQLLEKLHDSVKSKEFLPKLQLLLHSEDEIVPEPPAQAQPPTLIQQRQEDLELSAKLHETDHLCKRCGNEIEDENSEREAPIRDRGTQRYIDRVDVQILLFAMFPLIFFLFAVVWPLIRFFPDSDNGGVTSFADEIVKETKIE